MSMEEKHKVTRAERATTVGPLDRPPDDVDKPLPAPTEKPLPQIKEQSLSTEMSRLSLKESPSIDTAIRRALTDPRTFETIPAAFSLSFVLGKQPPNSDSSSLTDLLSGGHYYLVIQRTQALLTTDSSTLSTAELWQTWLLRAEALRLLLAPRLAAIELNRIKLPPGARVPWDFQVLKILLMGMASGRWHGMVREYVTMTFETRTALNEAEGEEKDVWRKRLRKLEELIVFALIEAKDYNAATRRLRELVQRYPQEAKYAVNLFHVYLQMGSLSQSESILASLPADMRSSAAALLAMAKEDYPAALEMYNSLCHENPHNSTFSSNLALTHLYNADAQSGISTLEPLVKGNNAQLGALPQAVYNLCTMYEIRDDKARSKKEEIMETVVSQYGDVCGKSHFKLDSLR